MHAKYYDKISDQSKKKLESYEEIIELAFQHQWHWWRLHPKKKNFPKNQINLIFFLKIN